MKYSVFKRLLILMLGMTVILRWSALAQQQTQSQQPRPQPIWGAASNGICVGVRVSEVNDPPWHENDFYCDINARNISTNRLWVWFPPLEQRYEIELRGPDGRRINQLKSPSLSQRHFLGLEPLPLEERHSLEWFFLRKTFDVRTNGLHTLIVSARLNVFTNFAVGRSQMREKPVYFRLPPVTNTFNILPNQMKK